MVEQINKWRTSDGTIFDFEIDALRHEINWLCTARVEKADNSWYQGKDDTSSSYGSSGGGGHD